MESGLIDASSSLVWKWQNDRYHLASIIKPFHAYWVYCNTTGTILVDGQRPSENIDEQISIAENNRIVMTTDQGWNLCGPWEDLKIDYPLPYPFRGMIWSWDNGRYAKSPLMEVFHGYWMYAQENGATIDLSR